MITRFVHFCTPRRAPQFLERGIDARTRQHPNESADRVASRHAPADELAVVFFELQLGAGSDPQAVPQGLR
ncbi:MAG: hypothetical protein ACREML_03995, partial [Vulcanimicrobiaceae bacterium]